MNTTEKVLAQIRKKLDKGLQRKPQEFMYLNKESLYEHFKTATGMNRIPVSFSESTKASVGAGILGFQIGTSGGETTNFDLSEPHLFEALEPHLREKYPEITNEEDNISNLQKFVWLQGRLYWFYVGPTPLKGGEIEERRTFLMLNIEDIPFNIACDNKWFSPFMPFLHKDVFEYNIELNVEILGFNTGALNCFSTRAHPKSGKSLVIVPTVILANDDRTRQEMEDSLRNIKDLTIF